MKSRWDSKAFLRLALIAGGALLNSVPARGLPPPENPADSLLALAAESVRAERWSEGARLSDEVLALRKGDIEANYYGAICRRESGKRTSLFLREIQWDKARAHFHAVFARDSSYRDILYQYALFREYDDELEEAVDAALGQVGRHPEQVESQTGLFRIGRHYISATDPGEAVKWLQGRNDMYSMFFLAELLRRHGRFREAESSLLRLQEMSRLPPQATCIALARLYACLGKEGEGLAQATYWNGVDNAASAIGASLIFEDLKPVINDDELERYGTLRSEGERILFVHAFWESRDPAPASTVNARLIEHFRRYAKAEKEYEYFGPRTLARNPDPTLLDLLPRSFRLNREFNDMGLIFIRHGEPDAYQVTSSQGDDNDSWLYSASADAPARIFIFARHMGVANDWRLTSIPTDPQMKSKVALWDTRYGVDASRWPQVQDDLESERRSSVAQALRSEHHTWEKGTKTIAVPHAIDAFRAENGRTLLDISYALSQEDIAGPAGDTSRRIPLEVGISIIPLRGGKSRHELDTLSLPAGLLTDGSYISLFRRTMVPDSVRVAMHVRSAGEDVIGTWSEFINVPSFQGASFSLSDLQLLLPRATPASIVIDGVRIVQSPFRAYRRSATLYSYLQVYNLVKDADGKAKYTAVYELIPDDPLRVEESIPLAEVTRDLSEDTRSEFQRVDLTGAKPGSYLLRVTVTDRKRVETLTRERKIAILP
ncbi:MAG TPA: GWxTD domain-containing protein [Bacteroidota bacterium]|nr:GWxTD domain-containing protein [Bacteroidota bacterium]